MVLAHRLRLGRSQNCYAFLAEDIRENVSHLRFIGTEQPWAGFENRDPGAEPAEELTQFERYVTATDNHQRLRLRRELHALLTREQVTGEIRHSIEAFNRRDERPRTSRDQESLRLGPHIADLDGVAVDEPHGSVQHAYAVTDDALVLVLPVVGDNFFLLPID